MFNLGENFMQVSRFQKFSVKISEADVVLTDVPQCFSGGVFGSHLI